jgi:serine/threonine protein kinase
MIVSAEQILDLLVARRLLRPRDAAVWRRRMESDPRLERGDRLIGQLVRAGKLTRFQARAIHQHEEETLFVAHYVLFERLGVGAMGQVYKALDRRRKRWAALKILRDEWTASPRHRERFQCEVRAAARLKHPHIVRAYDAGEHDGAHYLAMEYVPGPNLDGYLREHGPLPVDRAVAIAVQTARGLAYAHQRGVVHRDVKPANVLLAPGDVAKILDMGIARCMSPADLAGERLTQSGQILGTPHYMAPEQALDPKNAGPQADIYSLGCTLYRLLTGEAPYTGESDYRILMSHLRLPIPHLREKRDDAPESLDAVLRGMMAKKPEDRYFSMFDVIADLERIEAPSGSPRGVVTLNADFSGEETVTAVGRPAGDRRARWRMPEGGVTAPEVVEEPASKPSTLSVLRSLSSTQREDLLAEYAALPRVRKREMHRRPQRRLRQFFAACGASAILMGAGLVSASRAERAGSIAVEVYPPSALVEVFETAPDAELRRATVGELTLRAAPGEYQVRVTKDGFVPYCRSLRLEPGGRAQVYAVLRRR